MRTKKFTTNTLLISVILLIVSGCSSFLEETPRSFLTEDYFSTPEGLQGGVTAVYSYYRRIYGGEPMRNVTVFGTDEFIPGRDGGSKDFNAYASGLNSQSGNLSSIWNNGYTIINTCNGIIELGPNANLDEAEKLGLIAQARYLRANMFFILVQMFGDVPLNLEFNTSPSTVDFRDPVADVYEAIINDLNLALTDLPDVRPQAGRLSKASALHLLTKVYLTRASSSAAQGADYTNAFSTAKNLIDNQATYGVSLLEDYGDVFAQGNEDNSEVLWAVQWNDNIEFNDQGNGGKENRSIYYYRPLYESVSGIRRTVEYGRPWLRYKPNTEYLFDVAYAERENDGRYDNTFQVAWDCNDGNPPNGLVDGDTCLYMPGIEWSQQEIDAKPYTVITPSMYSLTLWPSMMKYDDSNRPDIQAPSIRPYIVYKLSEVYLLAAEAAVMGGGSLTEGLEYINTIRRRAAYRPENNQAENDAAAAAMEITAGELDIDFILTERSRELCGESMRWFDLKRTGKLIERVQMYNPDGAPNIQPFHLLRPIPQRQLDLLSNAGEFPQNPGY